MEYDQQNISTRQKETPAAYALAKTQKKLHKQMGYHQQQHFNQNEKEPAAYALAKKRKEKYINICIIIKQKILTWENTVRRTNWGNDKMEIR